MSKYTEIDAVLAGESDGCIVCGDCLEVMPEMPDGCVDAVVTDPPYGLAVEYGGYKDSRENLHSLLLHAIPELQRLSERLVITPGQTQVWLYPEADWIGCVYWNTTGTFGRYGYSQWLPVLLYGQDLAGFGSVNGVTKTDTMGLSGGGGVGFMRGTKIDHPCPKPLNVMEWLVKRFTWNNSLILDPLCGSGTTCVAAKKLGRRYIGIDISEEYCDIARDRLLQLDGRRLEKFKPKRNFF